MSGNLFSDLSVGLYSFDLQTIEIDNESLGLSDDDARKIIKSADLYSLSGNELKFYQTYLHEFIHYFDGTASLWGLEFCGRLYRYFETEDDNRFNVLALNASEIFLHDKFVPSGEKLTFTNLTVGIDYDDEHGGHSIVYYEFNKKPVYSVPLSLLSVLEGHAYSQEKLFTWKVYSAQNDIILQHELMREVEALLKDPDRFEYTCILSMVYQCFPELDFSQKLVTVIGVCSLALNVSSTRMAATPEWIIDRAFPCQPCEQQSSIRLDFMRGMNRASYAFIILFLFNLKKSENIDINRPICEQIEEVLDECIPEPFGDIGLKMETDVVMKSLESLHVNHYFQFYILLCKCREDRDTILISDQLSYLK